MPGNLTPSKAVLPQGETTIGVHRDGKLNMSSGPEDGSSVYMAWGTAMGPENARLHKWDLIGSD